MVDVFPNATFFFGLLLVVAGTFGCPDRDGDEPLRPVQGMHLRLEGAAQRTVGYGQIEEIVFGIYNQDEQPVEGVLVTAVFEGDVHGGSLSPLSVASGADGRATVVLEAPAVPVSFRVRLEAPAAAEAQWLDVTVDPQKIGFTVKVGYAGTLELSAIRVAMYEGMSCAEVAAGEPTATATAESGPPVTLWLPGAKAGRPYALVASGVDTAGTLKASRCLGNQRASGSAVVISLQDSTFGISGDYLTKVEMDAGALGPAVTYLQSLTQELFVSRWPSALLDGMYNALAAHDSEAAARFAMARKTERLDDVVVPAYAQAADIQLDEVSAALFAALREATSRVSLRGNLHIERQSHVHARFSASVDTVELYAGGGPLVLPMSPPVTGEALMSSTESLNAYFVSVHSFEIGIGTVLRRGLELIIEETTGIEDGTLASALTEVIDCEALADIVAEHVEGSLPAGALEEGCRSAFQNVEGDLLLVTEIMNNGSQLSMGGRFVAADEPGMTDAAALLGTVWAGNWTGSALTLSDDGQLTLDFVSLGPMPVVFTATRAEQTMRASGER